MAVLRCNDIDVVNAVVINTTCTRNNIKKKKRKKLLNKLKSCIKKNKRQQQHLYRNIVYSRQRYQAENFLKGEKNFQFPHQSNDNSQRYLIFSPFNTF